MLGFSAFELARLQFAFTVSFHIIFPAITIGLASYLAVLEALWLIRRNPVYVELYHFWSKIFAVNFGMGVVSGLVMAYEFGTNWSGFSQFAGGVTGPLLTYEVLTAFFLEAGFLGVMLFGWNKVGPAAHVCHGHGCHRHADFHHLDPGVEQLDADAAGFRDHQRPGRADRLAGSDLQSVLPLPPGAYDAGRLPLHGAFRRCRGRLASASWPLHAGVRKMFSMALWMLLFVAPIQMFVGDAHGLNTLEHQPAKIAAIEGHWQNDPNASSLPLIAFGIPDMKAEETKYAIEIPYLGSLILTHTLHGKIPGLKEFAPQDRPDSTIIFFTFRIMVGLGLAMLLLGLWGAYLRWRGKLFETRLFMLFALCMGPAGLIAVLAGWITTEVGRQPWVVYGILRTQDAVSNHSVLALSITLVMFIVMYFLLFGTGIGFMLKMVAHGPDEGRDGVHPHDGGQIQRPARPFSAAPDTFDTAPARETKEV